MKGKIWEHTHDIQILPDEIYDVSRPAGEPIVRWNDGMVTP